MYDPVSRFHVIVCRYCGQPFKTRYGRKRYCSDLCYTQAHPRRLPRYPRWTHQELRLLRQLAGELPVKEIAQRLGRTHQATRAKAKQYKISLLLYGERHPGARYTDAQVEQARTLYEEGIAPKAIAVRLGIPYSSIRDYVEYRRRLGPPIERYF